MTARLIPANDTAAARMKTAARGLMFLHAARATDLRDPVALADARTSVCDARAAFNVACGNALDRVDRNGYTITAGAR